MPTYRSWAPAALGVLVGAAVLLTGLVLPGTYEARVSLLAVPVASPVDQASQVQYGSVVALGLPALAEIVRSPSVLRSALPGGGAGELDALADATTVELVPSSAVARLTVTDHDPQVAATLVDAIADAVVRADLLAPVARLRPLDADPTVRDTSAGALLTVGLAIATGVAVGLGTWAGRRLFRRRLADESSVRSALAETGLDTSVEVLRATDGLPVARLELLSDAVGRPLRLVPVSTSVSLRVLQWREDLRGAPRWAADPAGRGYGPAVVLVVDGLRSRVAELRGVVHALPEGSTVVAVIVCPSGATDVRAEARRPYSGGLHAAEQPR